MRGTASGRTHGRLPCAFESALSCDILTDHGRVRELRCARRPLLAFDREDFNFSRSPDLIFPNRVRFANPRCRHCASTGTRHALSVREARRQTAKFHGCSRQMYSSQQRPDVCVFSCDCHTGTRKRSGVKTIDLHLLVCLRGIGL